jgi:hypothetical protein
LLAALLIAFAQLARFDAPELSFAMPTGWRAAPTADVTAPLAFKLTPASSGKQLQSAILLVGNKRIAEVDIDAEAAGWHAAHLKNRVAWGMHSDGGMPRDVVRGPAARKLIRYRDHVGSALGADEQTFTCGAFQARLACVLVFASSDSRDQADALTQTLFSQLALKRR